MIRAIIFDCFGVLYTSSPSPFNQPVAGIIARLRPRYRIGMLSNAERSFLEQFLAANRARDLFDMVMASSESAYAKPDREIFAEAAGRLSVSFSEILFIDDSPGHVSAATSYGIRSILYKSSSQLEQALTKAEIQLKP